MSELAGSAVITNRTFKKKGWQTIHSMIIVAMILHFSVILLFGCALVTTGSEAIKSFSVSLVRGPGGSEPSGKAASGGGGPAVPPPSEKREAKPAPVRKTEVVPKNIVKQHDVEIQGKNKKEPEIEDVKPKIQTENYPKNDQYFRHNPAQSGNNSGAPSAGSNMTGGSGRNNSPDLPGNGEGGSGGGKGSGGRPDGFQGIFFGYNYNLLPGHISEESIIKERKKYMTLQETPPQLVCVTFPNKLDLSGTGNAEVTVTITIPSVSAEELPMEGIKPENINITGVRADKPQLAAFFRQTARSTLNNSYWYPGRKNGKICEETITFNILIYGTDE
ncbi:MAG: hypothetical protein LWY06_16900 [Firmicutes bacterium]|nr:hypothetical protein [Bacillota bacterium]